MTRLVSVLALATLLGCGAAGSLKSAADLAALEAGCVDTATTRQASIDCRNAVRSAWAKANGITVTNLPGGSDAAVD